MKKLYLLAAILFTITFTSSAKVTREDVRELLRLQGVENLEQAADMLYQKYLDAEKGKTGDLEEGIGKSAVSGISMGLYQSRNGCYTHTSWLPGFMQDWYKKTVTTDMILGKSLTWQKVWRETDYIADRAAFNTLSDYFGDQWYFAVISHMIVKNTTAELIRHKMKYGRFF